MDTFCSILAATELPFQWTDAIVSPGLPLMLCAPDGNRKFSDEVVTKEDISALIDTIAVTAGISDRKEAWLSAARPRTPSIDMATAGSGDPQFRFRFTVARANIEGGFMVVARKIPYQIPTPETLGLDMGVLGRALRDKGLIFVTGPTRNAKSTVVASLVESLRLSRRYGHIIRIGDPLEYSHPVDPHCIITPREVGIHTNSIKDAAYEAMRMAPAAIEIGEVIEPEDALAVLKLGESGHLVLATMQSTTVEGALHKLLALCGHHPGAKHAIANSVRAVIRTALVPSVDGSKFKLAYEYIINAGDTIPRLIKDENSIELRRLLRDKAAGNLGSALNTCLHDLLRKGEISEETVASASNDPTAPEIISRSYRGSSGI